MSIFISPWKIVIGLWTIIQIVKKKAGKWPAVFCPYSVSIRQTWHSTKVKRETVISSRMCPAWLVFYPPLAALFCFPTHKRAHTRKPLNFWHFSGLRRSYSKWVTWNPTHNPNLCHAHWVKINPQKIPIAIFKSIFNINSPSLSRVIYIWLMIKMRESLALTFIWPPEMHIRCTSFDFFSPFLNLQFVTRCQTFFKKKCHVACAGLFYRFGASISRDFIFQFLRGFISIE